VNKTKSARPFSPRAAVRQLKRADPVLRDVIERVGPYRLEPRVAGSHLDALVRSIISQQLSTKAAATIHGRVLALHGTDAPAPAAWLALGDAVLREAGLSRQKIGYIRDLAQHVHDDTLPMARLHELDDDQVIEVLTRVKGIGVWTAQMFLMFRLGRPDVLPVLDLGIRNAMRQAYRMRKEPTHARMRAIAASWAPYRSVACWYLWQSLALPKAAAPARRKRSANGR
jgi:DNA-3-methyladenine glycosylase II